MKRTLLGVIGGLLLACPCVQAQSDAPPRIFINCATWGCYEEYVKTELSFFNYVRDRYEADIQILINSVENGNGGDNYSLIFIGQHQFEGLGDSLVFSTRQADTEDMVRTRLVATLRLGLARYVARTDMADQVTVTFPARTQEETLIPDDPWHYVVTTLRTSAFVNGESNQRSLSLNSSIWIRRVTDASRFSINIWHNFNSQRFTIDSILYTARNVGYGFSGKYVKSLSPHWSVGGYYQGNHSVFSNISFSHRAAPALEYNLYPYDENQQHQLRISYAAGFQQFNFIEETIYDRMRQGVPYHKLSTILGLTQPWGSVSGQIEASTFLTDVTRYNIGLSTDISLRLFEGFTIYFFGNGSLINDQISLAKSQADLDDFLLGGRQLPTSFSYFSSVGFSYTFGSINNSIVNIRLDDVN